MVRARLCVGKHFVCDPACAKTRLSAAVGVGAWQGGALAHNWKRRLTVSVHKEKAACYGEAGLAQACIERTAERAFTR